MALFGSRRRGSSAARVSPAMHKDTLISTSDKQSSSSSQQPLDANTAYAANVAARAAAAGSRPGTSSGLSSAAAAAALRSVTSSPEPVGSIQTKRMVRRGSNSSIGSASIMSGRGGAPMRGSMQRRGSQGSMTERTFRSPSPGRSRTNSFTNGGPSSPTYDAPPVPTIPKNVQQRAHQRSSSVDPPQRVYSPTPNGRGARTSSMDRSTLPPPVSSKKGARLSDVHESELERSNSQRAGQNFSRPRTSVDTSSPTSPTAGKQYVHGTGAWHSEPVQNIPRTNGGAGPNPEDLAAKMARIQGAQGQGVQRSNTTSSQQGQQLKSYTQPTITGTAVRPQARPQQATETVMVYDSGSRTFVPQIKTKTESSSQAGSAPAYDSNSRTFVPQVKSKPAAVEAPLPTQREQVASLPAAAPGTYDPHTRSIVPVLQAPTSNSKPALDSGLAPQPPALAPGSYDPATRTIVPGYVKPATPEPVLAPPPRNPARLSPNNSPRTSVVREDPDEDAAALDTPQSSRIIQTSVGPAKSYASVQQHQRSSSLDVPSRNTPSNRGRQVSASPTPSQRKTHFSASPVSPAERHEPPPRDISPAKSALKHSSPAASVRAASPLAHFSKGPGSDASSLYSQDGISSGKKKKSVRVSFDEQPHEIDAAAAASPKILSRERSPVLDDEDDEAFSKPRPALPTFGSVRKNREVAEKVTEMAPDRHERSNDHAIGGILHANGTPKPAMEPMPPIVTSKDVAANISDSESVSDVGDLGEYAAANAAVVSLPEKTAGQTAQIHEEPKEKSPVEPIIRDFASSGSTSQQHDPSVPDITLLPPTPGTEEFKSLDNRQSAEIIVPGGWSAEDKTDVKSATTSTATSSTTPVIVQNPEEHSPMLHPIDEDTDTDDAEFSDAAEDPSEFEGGFASLDAIAVSPIVVKPAPGTSPITGTTSPPESPAAQKAVRQTEATNGTTEDKSSGDWTSATAYWSQLSREQRERIERDHMSSDDEARPSPAVMKKTRKTTAKPTAAASPQTTPRSVPSHRDAQPAQPALKKTMRAQPEPTPVAPSHSMRRSMRDGGGLSSGSLRSSSAQPAAPEPRAGSFTRKTMRPQSSSAATPSTLTNSRVSQELPTPRPVLTRPVSSASTTRAPPVVSTRLQKELSHDSDSESSFKKKKRAANGAMTMRSSMRGGPPAQEQRPSSPDPVRKGKGKDSFSIRSLSPTGSLFGRKKMKDVRAEIRGSSVEPTSRMTTMRTSQPAPAKTMRQTPAAAPAQKSSGSRFKSRFADSDDSDDDAPAPARRGGGGGFRSRFADSDDEEEVLTPVRGIPRRKGQDDGDSTDLDDSDAEGGRKPFSRGRDKQTAPLVPDPADVDKAMEAARKKLGMTASPPSTPQKQDDAQGSALAQGSLRTSQAAPPARPQSPDINSAKKKSFMGGFLRRNRNSQASVMTVSGLPQSDSAVFADTPTGSPLATTRPTTQRNSSYIGTERPQSPTASPGKLIRRSSAQARQRMVRGDSSYSTATAPPMIGESSWENGDVPPVPAIPHDVQSLKGDMRPATSDGQGVRFSEDITGGSPGAYSTRTGKKKKFGLLRRAFGLHD